MNNCFLLKNQKKYCIYLRRLLNRKIPNPAKPPILPPSKQVLYRVVNGDWIEPQHVEELLWRRHVYNNAMLSIRKFFKEEIKNKELEGLGIENLQEKEAQELNELIKLNEVENAKLAANRAEREKVELEEFKQDTIREMEELLNKEKNEIELRMKEVQDCIDESKNFVTYENLREKIVEALENPVVFDYAIDLNGQKISNSIPVKYLEGQPPRQRGRLYDYYKNNQISITNQNQS